MDNITREQAVLLFDEYNRKLGEVYDEILDGVTSESTLSSPEFQADLQTSVINRLQPWFTEQLDGLAGGTPEAFFDELVTLDDVMDVFAIAAEKIDGDMPEYLMLRVGAFGDESSGRLLEMALAHDWTPEDGMDIDVFRDGLAIDLAALRALGQWTYAPAVEPVLNRFCALSEPDEYIADGIKAFAVPFAGQIVPQLSAKIEIGLDSSLKGPYEYLVIFLTEIGRAEPDEDIFQCLKKSFRSMEHKVIASICLGDYGDGRAVPLLKSYLERNVRGIDRQFFYETVSSIKRLGGDISDIQDPFRDFSSQKK